MEEGLLLLLVVLTFGRRLNVDAISDWPKRAKREAGNGGSVTPPIRLEGRENERE